MNPLHALRARLRLLLSPRGAEGRMDEEFRFHLQMETEANMAAGMSPREARRRALLAFGRVERHKEQMRDGRGIRWLEELLSDARYALRTLRRAPGFTAMAIVTLGAGLGVTTAVASVAYTVVLAPVPYDQPDRLIQIGRQRDGRTSQMLPAADVRALGEATAEMLTLGVARFRDVALGTTGSPARVRGVVVTGTTLAMLGVRPLLGRLPTEADDVPGGPCAVVLSHRVWSDHLGADTDVVGGSVRLDGHPCAVTAVMPEGFAYPAPYFAPGDLWLLSGPAGTDWAAEGGPPFLVFGRLAPGQGVGTVQAALDVVSARSSGPGRFAAMRWDEPSREASRRRLAILLAAAVLVLVIATLNFVTLQLARGLDRREEMATRRALGAGPGRLLRLVTVETGVLAAGGAAAGVLVAMWSTDLIVALRSFYIPRMEEVTLEAGGIAVCLGLAALAGLLAASASAAGLAGGRVPSMPLRLGRGVTKGRAGRRIGRALIAVETTLALVLLAGAGLLTQSYRELEALDPGFRSAGILHARVSPPEARYPDDAARAAFFGAVEDRVAGLPGVLDVALASVPPGVGAGARQPFALAGTDPRPGDWPLTALRAVSEGYFRTLGVPLVRGRGFEEGGGSGAALVNQAFVRRFFPEGDPLGRRLHLVDSPRAERPRPDAWTVVGIVADAHEEFAYTPAPPTVYVRHSEAPVASMAILAHTAGPPLALEEALRDAIAGLDPDQPVYGIRELEFILASEYDLSRLGMTLLAVFAGAALLLAIAGIYGVVAHSVGQRLREMGIRIAMGAGRGDVLRLVLGECGRFALAGVLVGVLAVATLGHRLGALTPVWTGIDARILTAAAVAVAGIALGAAYLPARRAASMDPLETLRQE